MADNMTKCIVPGCTKKDKKVVYFNFPRSLKIRLIWKNLLRQWTNDPNWNPKPSYRICSGHFPKDVIYELKNGEHRLQKHAIPQMSLNEDDGETSESTDNSDWETEKLIAETERLETEETEEKQRFTEKDSSRNVAIVETKNCTRDKLNPIPGTSEREAQKSIDIEVDENDTVRTVLEKQSGMILPKGKSNEVEKFKRRIIRAVARQISENNSEEGFDKLWSSMKIESNCDCKLLWERMRTLTLKKLKRLLPAEDRTDSIAKIARFTATDWLLFDLVLVHENIDVIGKDLWAINADEPEVLYELFFLVERYKIEQLAGTDLIDAWLNLTHDYNEGDRKCSPMMLQRRWFQIKEAARRRFYMFWSKYRGMAAYLERARSYKPTNLQIDVVRKHKNIITAKFPDWPELISQGKVILAHVFDERIALKGRVFVPVGEPDLELVEQKIETIDVDGESECKNANEDNIKTEPVEIPIDIDEMDSLRLLQSIHIPCETPFGQTEEPVIVDFDEDSLTVQENGNSNKNIDNNDKKIPFTDTTISNKEKKQQRDINECELHTISIETPFFNGLVDKAHVPMEFNLNSEKLANKNVHRNEIIHAERDNVEGTDTMLPKITKVTSISTSSMILDEEKPTVVEIIGDENSNSSNISLLQKQVSKMILEKMDSDKEMLDCFEIPTDIQFVDDGIILIDEDDDITDPEVSVKSDAEEEIKETDNEIEPGKIDLKLLLFPTVYTKKLEDMDVFRFVEFSRVRDKRIIDCAIVESKPVYLKNVKKEKMQETDGDEDITLSTRRNTVSWSSWLLKKPRVTSYNPIQLCKNPDFNTRLKRLTAGFLSYERNRHYLKKCKPLTIDLHKSFEEKLVNNTLHLKDVPVTCVPGLQTTIPTEITAPTINLHNVKIKNKPDSIQKNNASEFCNDAVPGLNSDFIKVSSPEVIPITDDVINVETVLKPNTHIMNNALNMNDAIQAIPQPSHTTTEVYNNVNSIITSPFIENNTIINNPAVRLFKALLQPTQPSQTGDRKRVVNLPNIDEVRRTNQKLLCAEVAPIQFANSAPPVALVSVQNVNNQEIDINNKTQNIVENARDVTGTSPNEPISKKVGRPKSTKTLEHEKSMENSTDKQNVRNKSNQSVTPKYKPARRPLVPWIERKIHLTQPGEYLIASDTVDKMLSLFTGETYSKNNKKALTHAVDNLKKKKETLKEKCRRQTQSKMSRRVDNLGVCKKMHLCLNKYCRCCCKKHFSNKRLCHLPKRSKRKELRNEFIIVSDDEEKKTEENLNKKNTKNTGESMNTAVECVADTAKVDNNITNKEAYSLPVNKNSYVPPNSPNELNISQKIERPMLENYENESNLTVAGLETYKEELLKDQSINVAMNVAADTSHIYHKSTKGVQPQVKIQNSKINSGPIQKTFGPSTKANQQNTAQRANKTFVDIRGVTQPTTQNCKSPVYIGKNKILLCSKLSVMPQTNDVTSIILPTGVHLVMLPNKEIAMSIDPGVELNQFQIEELQDLIRNIQEQINTLPTLNFISPSNQINVENTVNSTSVLENKNNATIVESILRNETVQNISNSNDNTELETASEPITEINSGVITLISDDPKEVQNNADSLKTVKQNEVGCDQPTSTGRKTILSDLMELSGISEEDAKLPEIASPKPYITLDPINIPFLKVTSGPPKSKSNSKESDNIGASALTALASRPDLKIVTAYNDLKEAFENKCSFYKFDIESGVIIPVSVCIRKKFPVQNNKAPPQFVDLTDDTEDSALVSETEQQTNTNEISQPATPLKLFRAIHPSILRNDTKGLSLIKNFQSACEESLLKRVDTKKILKLMNSHKYKQSLQEGSILDFFDSDKESNHDTVTAKRPLNKNNESDDSDDEPLAKIVKRRTELAAYSVQNVEPTGNKENDQTSTEEMTLLQMPNDILMDAETNPESPPEADSEEDCILGV